MDDINYRDIIDRISKIRKSANSLITQELSDRGLEGIVPAHGAVFSSLFQQERPIPITFLVKKIGRAKSTVTGIVKTLERHGYVFRQESLEDARSSQIGLTEKGWAIKDDFTQISQLLEERVYGDMPREERKRVVELLAQIEMNLKS